MPLKISDPVKEVSVLNKWADSTEAKLAEQNTELQRLNQKINAAAPAKPSGQLAATLAPDVTNVSALETGTLINGVTFSSLTVGYTAPNPLGTFTGVFVVVQNYNGSSSLVKVAEHNYTGVAGGSASFTFVLDQTNEQITLYVVAKNLVDGTVSDWTTEPHVFVTLDGKTADIATDDVKNGHGSAVPAPTNPANVFSYSAGDGGGASPAPAIIWTWPAFNIVKPDGTNVAVAASTSDSIPAGPSLSQVAGGARGATTLHAKVAYYKNNQLRGVSTDASFAVSANNLLTVASPTTPSPNVYDGWIPLVGTTALNTSPQFPVLAFGTNYTEPVGHFVSTDATYVAWNSQTGAVSTRDDTNAVLAYSTNFFYFPYWLISSGTLFFNQGGHKSTSPNFTNDVNAIFADGQYPLTSSTGLKGITPAATGSGGGGGGGTCPIKGTEILPIGFECIAIELPNEDWITVRAGDFELTATPSHKVFVEGVTKALKDCRIGEYVETRDGAQRIVYKHMYSSPGVCLKVEMAQGHTYWANGFLSHNIKP